MLRYFKGNLEQIEGVSQYPLFSLLLFSVFFVLLFWWVLTAKKKYLDEMKELPLEKKKTIKSK